MTTINSRWRHRLGKLLLIVACVLYITTNQNVNSLPNQDQALSRRHVVNQERFRRQSIINASEDLQSLNRDPRAPASDSNSSSQQTDSNITSSDSDEDMSNVVLGNFKCDFGSTDALESCRIKVINSDMLVDPSPLLGSWSLGSGKLALYQGGPSQDATSLSSNANDTFGGYIYYETSSIPQTNDSTSALATASNSRLNALPSRQQHLAPPPYVEYSTPKLSFNNQQDPYGFMSNNNRRGSNQRLNENSFQRVMSSSYVVSSQQMDQQTQSRQDMSFTDGPSFTTPNITAPGLHGMCLSFKYIIRGLSADELKVFVSDKKGPKGSLSQTSNNRQSQRQIWSSSESVGANWTKGEVLYSSTWNHSLVFSASSSLNKLRDPQQRKFRGYIAVDDIQVSKHDADSSSSDDLESGCKGHCNFDGDLCGWKNALDNEEDDFDWSFGRGSDNLFTGPSTDFVSSANNELTGSYLYTDSGYPRRPGDRALLLSPVFAPTQQSEAICMRIGVHMFGSGIGSLAIKLRSSDELEISSASNSSALSNQQPFSSNSTSSATNQQTGGSLSAQGQGQGQAGAGGLSGESRMELEKNDVLIWRLSGDNGNSWHQAQATVASPKSPYQLVIEGTIGENHLGHVAIDEVSFAAGSCPTSPPAASRNYGDCTFEQSLCHWRNPDAEIHLDDLDWIRTVDEQNNIHGPNYDHTTRRRFGHYLKLENTYREPKSGTRAFLLSPILTPKSNQTIQCLSFYYYIFMKSISASGPNLGTIRVYLASNNELIPIWRLTNPISSPNWKHARAPLTTALIEGQMFGPSKLFQIALEGIWGDAVGGSIAIDDITIFDGACDILPPEAKSVPGECTFDVDLCSWTNKTILSTSATAGSSMVESISTDADIKSPFLQSVNPYSASTSSGSNSLSPSMTRKNIGWQLATVDARPINLQDHTYKAPIGYAFVDYTTLTLNSGAEPLQATLQATEVTIPSGNPPLVKCLSFWFAAFGRFDANNLVVHLSQASMSTETTQESSSGANQTPASNAPNSQPTSSSSTSLVASNDINNKSTEESGAWRKVIGKPIWSVAAKNITEPLRRRWNYGQAQFKVDSNYLITFLASTSDGGFALDDISFYDGACETRPTYAKVRVSQDDVESESNQGSNSQPKR